jgi:hypothetical protein
MENSVLYYPTIEFQKKDYKWLWSASLLWDNIYRIVPPGFYLNEPENIRILCESGEIGKSLSPTPYVKAVGDEFSSFLDNYRYNAAALNDVNDTIYNPNVRVHHTKVDHTLKNILLYDKRILGTDDEWLHFDSRTANFYMTFLANHMAEKNNLSLYTHNRELWTASTYFLSDGSLQADCFISPDSGEQSIEALVSMMVADILPSNILDISPEEILRFREKRKDERKQFVNALNDFRSKLSRATAPEILHDIINAELKQFCSAKTDYKRSMDMLRVTTFGGVLVTLLSITANALGYLPYPQSAASIIETTSLGISVITGIAEREMSKRPKNPYSYLASINRRFSSCFPYESTSLLNRNSYSLQRDIEEFIND